MWYRHDGRADGSFRWAYPQGKKVGTGWNMKHVFAGGDGVIYAVSANNDLMWYRHDGRNDGSFRWAYPEGEKVGVGWDFKTLFSSGGGVIYGITAKDELMWYRHDGWNDGTFRWAYPRAKRLVLDGRSRRSSPVQPFNHSAKHHADADCSSFRAKALSSDT